MLRFLLILGRFQDPILKVFLVPWTKIGVFLHACFQVAFFLTIFGDESGRLGLQKQAFGVRVVAKTIFPQKLEF